MTEEKISQEFRLKNIDETRHYFMKEINQNELTSKKGCGIMNYIEHLPVLVSAVTGCVSISAFCFSWYSRRYYEFCIWIKNLYNNCRNQKV